VVPVYDDKNRLAGLSRPARLRLEPRAGCASLSPLRGAAVFFCKDRLIHVPLEF
jgi:hypothetical protein